MIDSYKYKTTKKMMIHKNRFVKKEGQKKQLKDQ